MGDPGPLEKLEEFLNLLVAPIAMMAGAAFFSWDKAKLDEIKAKFKPYAPDSGMGCMQACYDVVGILYGGKTSQELSQTVRDRAYAKANATLNKYPEATKKLIADAKAADPTLTDAKARQQVLDRFASNDITSDHTFELMRERGMAGDRVHVADAGAEQAIRQMTGNAPGVYFYGMAVNDYHTVTLAVERAADGTQKMYWMDQHNPGIRTEIKSGALGATLTSVWGDNKTTNIYAFKPPAGAGGKP